MFQATGTASGSSGFVNITDLKGGKVGFGAEDNGGNVDAVFVKSLDEVRNVWFLLDLNLILHVLFCAKFTPLLTLNAMNTSLKYNSGHGSELCLKP